MRENYIRSTGLLQVSAYTLIYLVIKPEQNVVLKVTLHLFQDTNICKLYANLSISGMDKRVRIFPMLICGTGGHSKRDHK